MSQFAFAGMLAANSDVPALRLFIDDAPFVRTTSVPVAFIETGGDVITDYRLSNDGDIADGVLVNGSSVPKHGEWGLAPGPDGPRRVYGQVRYQSDGWSPVVTQDLVLDTSPGSMVSVDLDPQSGLGYSISLPPGADWHGVFALPKDRITARAFPAGTTSPTAFQVTGGRWGVHFGDKEKPIAAGTYEVPPPTDAFTTASLYAGVSAGDGNDCNGGGTFTIHEIEFAEGDLAVLSADFRLTCYDSYVVSGSVRYGNDDPIVALDPSIDDAYLGMVDVGSPTGEQTASFTNSGTIATTLGSARFQGHHPGDFEITSDTCSGKELAVGESCSVSARAVPTARGNRSAVLAIPDETPRTARRVLLRASGLQPTTTTVELESVPQFGPATATVVLTVYPAPAAGYVNLFVKGVQQYGPTSRVLEDPSRLEYRYKITLPPGKQELTGYYRGEDFYRDSASVPVQVEVGTATKLHLATVTDDGVAAGESADLIARLTAGAAVEGGTLTIRDSVTGELLATKTVSGSSDSLTHGVTRALGTHPFEAEFVPPSADVQEARTSYELAVVPGPRPETVMDATALATNGRRSSTEFSSPDPDATFQCRYDASNWYACASPTPLYREDQGTSTFSVRARRGDGLADRTPASRTFIVDFDPPTGSISIARGATYTRTSAVSVSVPASDALSGVTHVDLSLDDPMLTYAPTVNWTLPHADGTATVWAQWRDAAGNWSEAISDTIVLDTVAPVATAPRHVLASETSLVSGAVPVRLRWSGSDATSGIARYEVRQQVDAGSWTTLSRTLTAASLTRNLTPGHAYRFAVRAVDKAGNVGAFAYGPRFSVVGYQESSNAITYRGRWTNAEWTSYWGGRAKAASATGATATLTATGRSVALVSSRGPTRGKAAIYVNGTLIATVDLYASTWQHRRLVWARNWPTSATRTIVVRVSGTLGRPRVDLDAFVVLR